MSYTNINSIKKITTGDEAGTWGDSTNINLEILDVASRGFEQLTINDADQTLTLSNQPTGIENGHYHAIEFQGSISQERTITLEQDDHKLVYMVLNNAGNTLRFKQGNGTGGGNANEGTVTIANGKAGIILANGAGSTNAKIVDLTASVDVSTATALATARNFSITGDVTASAVSFDGTGNVALNTAFASGVIVNADVNASAAIDATKIADGTVTSTEFQFINSLSSNAQTQIDSKQASITGAATTITSSNLTADRVVTSNGSGKIEASSDITTTELGYLNNVSSNIQTQLDAKQATITGAATTIDDVDLTASRVLVSNSSGKVAVSSTTTTSLGNFIDGSALNASNLSSGTVPDARLPSSISSDITGNAATATTAAALTGDVTKTGDFTVDASGDIVLDADGSGGTSNFKFKNGSGGGTFNMAFDNSENMVITGAQSFRLSTGGDINLDADGGQIFLRQGNTQRGFIDVQNTSTLDFHAGTSSTEALKITTSGVNVVQGLRVGDTTAPTDNDLHVVGDITCDGTITGTMAGSIPSGGIILWSGASNAIPSGYVLCDGNNSTPDLRDRFVVGAGSTYSVNDTGGSSTVTLSTSEIPAHTHSVTDPGHTHLARTAGSGSSSGTIMTSGEAGSLTFAGQMSTVTTGISLANAGSGGSHENKPPYFALCYIMKT